MRALIFFCALVLAAPAWATTDVSHGPEHLDGHWQLDWKESDSFEPVMQAMETPWLVRKLAGIARVRVELQTLPLECDQCATTVRVKLSSPLSSDETVVILDDVARPGKDPRGRPTMDRYTWSTDRGFEMIREFVLPSGKQARLRDSRELGDEPDIMISILTVWVDDEQRAEVRRVFKRISAQ